MTGPSDTILTWCDDCERYVEYPMLHAMAIHPPENEKDRLAAKRNREAVRQYRRSHRKGLWAGGRPKGRLQSE